MLAAGRPYWDELTSSAIARCARRLNVSLRRLGDVVLERPKWRSSFGGASPLEPLAALFGLTPEELLWNHTTFPYGTAFLREEAFARALRNTVGLVDRGNRLGAVSQNATIGVPSSQYCQQCVAEELAHTGESFWHRAHNLPGVWTCAKHGSVLLTSDLSKTACNASLLLPHEVSGRRVTTGRITDSIRTVARLSHEWLNRPWTAAELRTDEFYRTLAASNGWLTSDQRSVNRLAMHRHVQKHFPAAYLRSVSLPTTAEENDWPSRMLRQQTRVPYTPLKHAILEAVLSHTRTESEPLLNHIVSGPPRSDAKRVDAFYAQAARKALKQVLREGEQLSTPKFLRSVGCHSAYRRLNEQLPLLRAVVREFRSSDASVRKIGPDKSLYRKRNVAA